MPYTWKELAELLGVSVRTVRRSAKKLGVTGTLTDREGGGTVRVFSEVDVERLKALSDRPFLPVKREEEPEGGLTTALTNGLTTALETLGQIREGLAELPELRAQVGEVVAALREQGAKTERTQEALLREVAALREELGRPWWERIFKPKRGKGGK